MGLHPWPMIDPASSYLTMTSGAGPAPMQLYSDAMLTQASSTDGVVLTSQATATGTFAAWDGRSAFQAAASLTTHNTDQSLLAELAMMKAEVAQAAANLHTFTVPRMVTHVQANANRAEYGFDNAINPSVLWSLTPRLIELELEYYGYVWPNNAQAGVGYGVGLDGLGAALAALSALPSLAGGSPAAAAMAAADVAANAGITMASATMSGTEHAAMAVVSPAAAAPEAATGLLGHAPLAAPATSTAPVTGTPTVSPMVNVQTYAPAVPPVTQAQAPVMSMFAPPPTAAVTPPAPAPTPPVQTLTPVSGSGTGPPGVTSFMKPAEPFAAPPTPSGGQAVGLNPGMLNAAALRGPATTAPIANTAVLTQPLSTATSLATQPLAYVPPTPPQPQPAPPSQALLQLGTIQTLQPPPSPPPTPPPPPPAPSAVPQSGPPASSTGPNGTGTHGTGIQMLGTGTAEAPQAPIFPPIPLDPSPPVPPPPVPPPPSPGQPPLQRRPDVSSWTAPPRAQDARQRKRI